MMMMVWRKCLRRRGDGWLDGDVVNLLCPTYTAAVVSISLDRLNSAPDRQNAIPVAIGSRQNRGTPGGHMFPHSEISDVEMRNFDATNRQSKYLTLWTLSS